MQALYFTPDGATADNATNPLPQLPIITGYPQTSAIAVLPLEAPLYRTQVSIVLQPLPTPSLALFLPPFPPPPPPLTPNTSSPWPNRCAAPLDSKHSLGQKRTMQIGQYSSDLVI